MSLLEQLVEVLRAAARRLSGPKLAPVAVTESKLADAAVTGPKLGPNAVTGDNIADGSIAAADIDLSSFTTQFWKTDGNSGTMPGTHFLGTSDSQALELKVNGARALRLEPNATGPNVIGGASVNYVSAGVVGATIGGGGTPNYFGFGFTNSVKGRK